VIPDDVLEAIGKVRFVWVSHGHPDHLSPRSISLLRDKTMLLPDHVGGRIATAFSAIWIGFLKVACCHPDAVSPVNVTVASSCPEVVQRFPTCVRR
jgi:mRNA degradation ribonuclease J1/J2